MAQNKNEIAYEPVWKIRLKLFWRNLRKNWALFTERKVGLFGLYIIIGFAIFGALYPVVSRFLDPAIYNPVIGTDPHVRDLYYITDHMSAQNVIKGLEIPSSKFLAYAIMDQGEGYLSTLLDNLDRSQKEFVGLDNPQAFRHVLKTLVDNYMPRVLRSKLQFELASLLRSGMIKPRAIASVEELADRSKFSLDSFGALVEDVGVETLARAFAGVSNERIIRRIALRVKILYGEEAREEFYRIMEDSKEKAELIVQAQAKVFDAVSKLVANGLVQLSLNIEKQRDLEYAVENNILSVPDLLKVMLYEPLRVVATYLLGKGKTNELEEYLAGNDTPEIRILKSIYSVVKRRVLEMVEGEGRELYVKNAEDILKEDIEVLVKYGIVNDTDLGSMKVGDVITIALGNAGRNLALSTFDVGAEARIKILREIIESYPTVYKAYRMENESLMRKVAEARFYLYMCFIEGVRIGLTQRVPLIPLELLDVNGVDLVKVMDIPVAQLLSYAIGDKTKLRENLYRTFRIEGDVNFKRLDVIELLDLYKNHMSEFAKLAIPGEDFGVFKAKVDAVELMDRLWKYMELLSYDAPRSFLKAEADRILKLIAAIHTPGALKAQLDALVPQFKKFMEDGEITDELIGELYNVLMVAGDELPGLLKLDTVKSAITKDEAKKMVVRLYDTLAVKSLLGVSHPLPPSRWHPLGTDPHGRDIFVQLMRSTPSEFALGVLAALITVVIGTLIGTTAAYYGGLVDAFFMRLADIVMLFPTIAFLIVLSGFIEMDLIKLAIILGLLSGFGSITLVLKAQALTIKVKPFIEAARVAGGTTAYIIFNHIIPNVMPLSFLYMMFNVTSAVFSEAVLSFFGLLKVRMSWGIMINTVWNLGYLSSGQSIGAYWWTWVPAGAAITLLCSAFYFLGRGLEEIVNPRLRKR